MTATPTAAVSNATPTSPPSASPTSEGPPISYTATDIQSRGEELERVANSEPRRVTWKDGTTYEESISDLVFRTAGKPGAGHGQRVVARWLGGNSWQVTILMRVADHSTEPPTETDLVGEFYYDEEKDEFTAANGRALFALTGADPCTSDQPQLDYCPLDKEIQP